MPVVGHDNNVLNFLSERIKNQIEFWPEFVEKWDEEAKGKRFKSEALSLTELWNLYLGYVREVALEDDDAVISRIKAKHEAVKKPKKGYAVIPIRTFELP